MTGPEAKILSGYSSIGQQHAKPEEPGSHPGIFRPFVSLSLISDCALGFVEFVKDSALLGATQSILLGSKSSIKYIHYEYFM